MKNLKNIVLYLSILSIIAPCFAINSEFDQSCTYLIAWSTDIWKPYNADLIYNGKKNIRELTKNFCDKVYSLKCSDSSDWVYATDYFDASQSIFLSILCESVQAWTRYTQTNWYLKKKNFIDFGILSSETWYQESCYWLSSYWTMNDCDYSYYLPLIFNKIMNDFFSVKQARNFWIEKLEDEFVPDDAANKFSKDTFPGIDMQQGICNPDNKYYKTTCKKLKGYMTDANNLLKNTEILDVAKLSKQDSAPDCENDFSTNILYCGLLWSNSYYKFINTVYNEYFWYKLFLSYYSFYINGFDYLDNSKADDLDKLQENKEKIYLTQNQLVKSKQAITLSLQTLSEMSYSFPLHVGFLMYHEDAKYFMENISKIYTPIKTLNDKLRNVQIKEE